MYYVYEWNQKEQLDLYKGNFVFYKYKQFTLIFENL